MICDHGMEYSKSVVHVNLCIVEPNIFLVIIFIALKLVEIILSIKIFSEN